MSPDQSGVITNSNLMTVSLNEGFALILSPHLNVTEHAHSALQITIALNGQKLYCKTNQAQVEGEIILVPPLANHSFEEKPGSVLVILIDSEYIVAESTGSSEVKALESADFQDLWKYLSTHEVDHLQFQILQELLYKSKILKEMMNSKIDDRIQNLIEKIKSDDNFLPTAAEAAQICFLSESRFLHLFKQELGLPFRKYLLWIKLKRALKHLKMGRSLTEVAQIGGFSDSAHLSRFFRESFGITPSEVFQNSQFIQAK